MTSPSGMPSAVGRFRIDALLGSGGMGAVYKAFDPALRREVAVKTIRPDVQRPGIAQRFYREAQALARLNHKHIIVVFDVGEFSGGVYIAMEYLRGEHLGEAIGRGTLSLRSRLDILVAVLDGLQHAHDNGVIHRDIKPSNVHLLPDGTVKLLDFGIASVAESETNLTGTSDLLCTPQYASPEQLESQEADGRSDIYSTGAMAYYLLSGRRPFDAPSVSGLLTKVLTEQAAPLPGRISEVLPELDHIVRRAMAKSRGDRYQSATEMKDAVERLMRERADTIAEFETEASFVSSHESSGPASATGSFEDREQPFETMRSLVDAEESGSSRVPPNSEPRSAARAGAAVAVGLLALAAVAVLWFVTRPDAPRQPEGGSSGRTQGAQGRDANGGRSPRDLGGADPGTSGPVTNGSAGADGRGSASPAGPSSTGSEGRGSVGSAAASGRSAGGAVTTGGGENLAEATHVSNAAMPAREMFNTDNGAPQHVGLKYRVVQLMPSGQEVDADPAQRFHSGDRVKFVFESNIDGFLYVAHLGSSGRWSVLFPNPSINAGLNEIGRGSAYEVPSNGWFRFEGDAGTEQVFVVVSRDRLKQMPGFAEPVSRTEVVSAQVIDDLRNRLPSRDLVFETDRSADGPRTSQVTYIVNRSELAAAVAATLALTHEQ